jgi:hypothetical protein
VDYTSTHVPGLHAMVMFVFQQAGLTPQVAQEATQVQTVISLVQSGMGSGAGTFGQCAAGGT